MCALDHCFLDCLISFENEASIFPAKKKYVFPMTLQPIATFTSIWNSLSQKHKTRSSSVSLLDQKKKKIKAIFHHHSLLS